MTDTADQVFLTEEEARRFSTWCSQQAVAYNDLAAARRDAFRAGSLQDAANLIHDLGDDD